jgi:hypothetical protein
MFCRTAKLTNEHVQHLPEFIEVTISMGDRQAGDHILGLSQIILAGKDILALRQLKATLELINTIVCLQRRVLWGDVCVR